MTEKTRVRLGAYFLFALLLLTVPTTLLVTHYEAARAKSHWVATSDGVQLVKPTDRTRAVDYVQKSRGLSREGAERVVAQRERETGLRVGAPEKLPFGSQLDYYEVDGTRTPNSAQYKGSAMVLDPKSPGAATAVNAWRNLPGLKKQAPGFLKYVNASLDKGFLLAPLGMVASPLGGNQPWLKKGGLSSKAGTTNIRIAVVCTILPGFRDISPRSDGDTEANDTGSLSVDYATRAPSATPTEVVYRQVPSIAENVGLVYNYATTADTPAGGDHNFPFSLYDTPSGVFSTGATWGVPTGVPAQWDYTQEAMAPHATHATNVLLQNDMYDLFFNPTYSEASVANWFYANSHGQIHIDGTSNDIVGWLRSAHQTNRFPYQIGGGNSEFVFPGTPVIRDGVDGTPLPATGYDYAANQIVRATLSSRGCTILFSHPVAFSIGNLSINAYTTADIDEAANTQNGNVDILFDTAVGSSWTVTMDPYDARRWTITNPGGTGWRFKQVDSTSPPSPTYTSFTSANDRAWTLTYAGYTYIGGDIANVRNTQMHGCPDLQNTLITDSELGVSLYNHHALDATVGFAVPFSTTDTAVGFGGRPFARLKSMWYYTRSYSGTTTRQIAHLSNEWGYADDISGTAVRSGTDGYNPRVYPFDTGPNDTWNGGYWSTGATVREGSAGEYSGDVGRVMADNGITLSGYQRVIYIAADGGVSAPGEPETTSSGFQPSSSLNNFNESGAGVAYHELAHTFGAGDLYDNDLYANHSVPPPVPAFHECYAMGKYSIMDSGGRLDAYHLIGMGYCTPQVITQDTLGVQLPEVESMLRDPVVLKIPGNPYYLKNYPTIPDSAWQEYYLVENRNVNSSDGNGGYGFDTSDKGLYIYHIDTRGMARNNTRQAGFQREDDLLSVIVEQADGKYELEFSNKGATTQTFTTDAFGSNTASRVDRFWQFPMFNGDTNHLGLQVAGLIGAGSPTSYSHGFTRPEYDDAVQNTLIPGTETDSFARIINISNIGNTMTADVYVEPAELRVTGTSIAPAEVQQGVQDVGFLKVTMENRRDDTAGKTDYSRMSTKDVYVDTLRILESGTSSDGNNLTAVKLYQDAAPANGTLDVPGDALIAQGTVITTAGDRWRDYAVFSNLGYRVPVGQSRTLFIAYDVAPEAQTNPHITVGAEFTDASKIVPRTPGTVEVRERIDDTPNGYGDGGVPVVAGTGDRLTGADPYHFGSYMFPVFSNTATIVNFPDRLVITPSTDAMPTSASQGQTELPMLRMHCEVNPDGDGRAGGAIRLDSIQVDEVGTANALSDIASCKLYMDDGDGVFDYTADTELGSSSFTLAGAAERALFPNLNLLIPYGTPRNLFLAVNVAATAEVGKDLQLRLSYAGAPGPPDPDPADCFVKVMNNATEAVANRDFVEFATPDAVWPLESQVVTVIVPNQPPYTPIAPFTPGGGQQISDATPTLTWSMPDPPDPDTGDTLSTLHYELQVANNSSFTTPISGTTAVGPSPLAWTVPDASALALNTDYWWRVRVVDAQGATSPWCAGQSFRLVTNRAPNQIAETPTPTGDITTRTPGTVPPVTTTGPLSWNATTDPDASDTPDTLCYVLQVDDNSDFSSPIVLSNVTANGGVWDKIVTLGDGTKAALSHPAQTTYPVLSGDGLDWGTYYFFRVAAQDVAGALSAWSPTATFRPVQDRHPETPVATFTPSGGAEVETPNPVVTWNMPATPDQDPTDPLSVLYYKVQLKRGLPEDNSDMTDGTIINFTTTAGIADVSPADGIPDSMEWLVDRTGTGAPLDLVDDAHYYWRVRAFDDEDKASDWSGVQDFWVNLVNDRPLPPTAGFIYSNGVQISDSTPTLSWYDGSDPDHSDTANTLHYVIQLSLKSDCSVIKYQYTTTDGVIARNVTTALADRSDWYWRAKTVDNEGAESDWSDIQHFYLDVNNTAPVLSNPSVTPMYGPITTFYQLFVTYTDAENDQPGKVYCVFDFGTGREQTLEMSKQDGTDVDATDGIRYVLGIAGTNLGLGAHTHYFYSDNGRTTTRLPLAGTDLGPIIGEGSTTWFTAANGVPATVFEEGQPVYVKVADNDQNQNAALAETLSATVSEAGGDSELVTLTETGVNTAIFRGSIPTLGRAGVDNDHVLNAIGGPSGDQLTVSYTDPDDGSNPSPDTTGDTAMLYDTIAPNLVNKRLTVSSGPHGRTATLDWSTYDEAAQIDVAGYHVYYSNAAFTSTAAMTPYATLSAGTFTTQVVGLTPNKAYWFVVVPFDEVPNERTAVAPIKLVTRDTSAPVISAENPARGSTEVARDTTVSFYLDDQGVGISRQSLVVTLTENGAAVPIGPLTIEGDKTHMKVTATPTSLLHWNGVVTVNIDVLDLDGNELIVNDWVFSLVTDTELPTLDTQVPAPNATNVAISSSMSFHLKDNKSGINQGSIHVTLNGTDITSALSFSGTNLDTTVLYDPPVDLLYSSTYTLVVTAADDAGNALGPITWSFDTVKDNTGVTVDQYDPARNATDVPIDTNVSFRLSDPQAGIEAASLRLWVHNVEVTGSPALTITQTPATGATPSTMLVSYNPPDDLPYSTDIHVQVYAKDGVGNVTDLTYKFTTIDAPTYNVSGVITNGTGSALAGVTVTAGGKTATSDGTGGYRIIGLLAGTYTVTPTRAEYVFEPTSTTVTVGGANDDATEVDFVGSLQTYTLTGRVKLGQDPLPGVAVVCNGQTATTNANGVYRITGLPNGQYTVTPALANYHFQPTSRAALVESKNVTGVDFAAIADTFTISGTAYDNAGNPLQGVQISCGTKAAVTNAAGQYLFTVTAGTYQLTASKSGYFFTPAQLAATVPSSQTGKDFTAYLTMATTFPSGYNLIGVPGTPADTNPANVFVDGSGNPIAQCYRWIPSLIPPRYLVAVDNQTDTAMQVKPGRGFFVRFNGATTMSVPGAPTDTTKTTSIGLTEGWNMIANPTSSPIKWSHFVPSVANGIRPFAFVYDTLSGSYLMVSSEASVSADRDTLLGWEGAWVRATEGGVSLLVSDYSSTSAIAKPAEADLNGGWLIPIVARAGSRGDYTSVAGLVPQSAGSHTIENPPTAPATVDVYFTDTAGARLAHDIRSEGASQTYDFVVSCAVPNSKVTLSLPDLSGVPATMQVALVDKTAGTTTYARTMQGYTYQSKGDSSERSFQLVVSPRTTAALAVTASAATTKGAGVMLTYNVTKACAVSIRLLNLAGRTVKTLAAGKAVTAGVQTQLWNLTSDNGTNIPAGSYLLQIDAATEDGQQVRGLTQVRVTR